MSENTLGDFMERRITEKEAGLFIRLMNLMKEVDEDLDDEVDDMMSERLDNLVANAQLVNKLWKEAHPNKTNIEEDK